MSDRHTRLLGSDPAALADAAAILKAGGIVAFPTETVYGLGADARDDRAVAQVFAAKGRPAFNPLIVHLVDAEAARTVAQFDDLAERLAAAFWPGPLTLVLPMRSDAGISALVTTGLGTVALRVPAHPVARGLLAAFGGPVAAPSANPSGRVSPTTASHVMAGLAGRIDAVVDGGACGVGLESTIIGLDGPVRLLRPGGLPVEAIEACLGGPLDSAADPDRPVAPGQLASHYAPKGVLRMEASGAAPGEVFVGFGPGGGDLNLSPSGDLTEAAANLFRLLHRLDEIRAGRIAVAPIPERGLGRAINDRLRRAAAPRG
ncbi:MAG: threonylcarbamoyl-AMP synthase [Rubellimicrobium sp.]|nr:threonylcarbamoyl-AMP synthase [Rubellimicrobium sp.]